MNQQRALRRAFTLIELLTVIAIIAILAALIFPVFNRMRENVRQGTCMSQMRDIYIALKQYREDNQRFPAALLGFVQNPDGSFYGGSGDPAGIEQLRYRPLTTDQKYLKDKNVFHCPDDMDTDPKAVTTAQYPPDVPMAQVSPGGVVFTPAVAHNMKQDALAGQTAYFYQIDSYDVGPRLNPDGTAVAGQMELHYSLDWTGKQGSPDDPDAPNQLKYKEPPADQTVITWCTHHAATAKANMIPVLMLSGNAKTAPVSSFVKRGPLGFKF